MAQFKAWKHPATGAIRIYVERLGGQGSTKVWIEKQDADSFGDEWIIRSYSNTMNKSEQGELKNQTEEAVTKLAGKRVKKWDELLKVLKVSV